MHVVVVVVVVGGGGGGAHCTQMFNKKLGGR
jgi:hypothetical protein